MAWPENNLSLYDRVRAVPDSAKKRITGGRLNNMTNISPMWRIKALTEEFGPCGIGWKPELVNFRTFECTSGEIMCFVDANLYYKIPGTDTWSEPVFGTGGSMLVSLSKGALYADDEAFKKAWTDALSVCCKQLGIGADVYWESDEGNKYGSSGSGAKPARKPVTPPNIPAAPGEVTQAMLNEQAKNHLANKSDEEKAAIAEKIKAINGGKANYRAVEDMGIRKKLYELFGGKV